MCNICSKIKVIRSSSAVVWMRCRDWQIDGLFHEHFVKLNQISHASRPCFCSIFCYDYFFLSDGQIKVLGSICQGWIDPSRQNVTDRISIKIATVPTKNILINDTLRQMVEKCLKRQECWARRVVGILQGDWAGETLVIHAETSCRSRLSDGEERGDRGVIEMIGTDDECQRWDINHPALWYHIILSDLFEYLSTSAWIQSVQM